MYESRIEQANGFPWAKVALFSVAAYVVWVNRFRIQETLEANGIATPWLKSNLGEAIGSGAAKVSGMVKHETNPSPIM